MHPLNKRSKDHAIEIAPRTWWVGHYLPGDPFQCHAYLIEHGDQSVLVDPGSALTFPYTLSKIEEVIPFSNIRYFLCHHQDPDITASLMSIDQMVRREDAMVISHWRANVLLKHYGLKLSFICVEKIHWSLDLGGRILQFIFTPYLHFPGAFCTFDVGTGTLFSSDLFGGFTEKWQLAAEDESYFEAIRPFHEHYMPSQDILQYGIAKLERFPIQMIAPQHGSLIPKPLVGFMMDQLKSLDCGLFLMTHSNSDFQRLSQLNRVLREVMNTMVMHRDFSQVVARILELAQPIIPVIKLEFYSILDNEEILHLAPESGYRGKRQCPPEKYRMILGKDRFFWDSHYQKPYLISQTGDMHPNRVDQEFCQVLVLPLFSTIHQTIQAVVIFHLSENIHISEEMSHVLSQISMALGVAVEREVIYQSIDMERQRIYERSIRDTLTNLYTRVYMQDTTTRLCRVHDRDENATIAIAMFDIDHFKSVNDTYGHAAGDLVLKRVAQVLITGTRSVDLPVRMGGEEFAVFILGTTEKLSIDIAERIRIKVTQLTFEGSLADRVVTISCGLIFRRQEEPLEAAMERADVALYQAKNGGRNRIVVGK
ncbi:MAG: diguanylate cyclase [Magnetococcus sp. DMHC-6]